MEKELKIGLLSKEEVDAKRVIIGSFSIDQLGDKVYQLPNGSLCGQVVWDNFNENLINLSRI